MTAKTAPFSAGQPLCLNQEQLLLSREWMETPGNPGSPPLTPSVLSFQGPLNFAALEQALNEIARRHPALRTYFYPAPEVVAGERAWRLRQFGAGAYLPGAYRQFVTEEAHVTLQTADAMHLDPGEARFAFEKLLREEADMGFDFARAPRLRATLFVRGAEDHLLIVMVDHAVADAWSMRILRKELVILYDRFAGNESRSLPETGLSYPDYADRQNLELSSVALAPSVDYWKRQWESYGPWRVAYDDLPLAKPARRTVPDRFAADRVVVDPDVCDAIRTFARLSRLSLNMFFFAAYAIVLHCYTCKRRLGLWCNFANRGRPEVQDTIGYFVHRHLIGLDFPDGLTGSSLLWQTRKAVLNAYEHQHIPLAHVWQAMNRWPRYADSRVLADYHQADEPWEDWELTGGLRIRRLDLPVSYTPRLSSLGLYVRDSREGMVLEVQYSQDRFSPAAVCGLLDDIQAVIGHLFVHPDRKIRDFFTAPRYGLTNHASESISKMGEFVKLGPTLESGWPEVESA